MKIEITNDNLLQSARKTLAHLQKSKCTAIRTGSRTEPEPEFYKPVSRYFCRTLTEPEPHLSNRKERTGTEPNNVSTCEP